MTVLEEAEKLAFKEYNVSLSVELRAIITDIAYQEVINKYIDEAKKRIIRQKQDEANKYEPTDTEIMERLQAKLDAAK